MREPEDDIGTVVTCQVAGLLCLSGVPPDRRRISLWYLDRTPASSVKNSRFICAINHWKPIAPIPPPSPIGADNASRNGVPADPRGAHASGQGEER